MKIEIGCFVNRTRPTVIFVTEKLLRGREGISLQCSPGTRLYQNPRTWCKFEYLENVVSGLIVLSDDTSGSQRYCEQRTVPLQDKIYSCDRSRKERKTKASQSKQSERVI